MMQIYFFSTIIASFRRLGLLGFFTVHLFSVHLSRSKTKIDRLGIRVEVFEMASNARRDEIFSFLSSIMDTSSDLFDANIRRIDDNDQAENPRGSIAYRFFNCFDQF